MIDNATAQRMLTRIEGNCAKCGRESTPADDRSTLNCHMLCRVCQRAADVPMPWKRIVPGGFEYGCYFPSSDLNVSEMGHRGTGKPEGVEWTARGVLEAAREFN
jgi:hypothetical protein